MGKSKDEDTGRFGVWWGLLPGLQMAISLGCHVAESVREFSGVSLMRTPIPFTGLHAQDLITSQRPHLLLHQFSSVQSLSRVWLFATPWTAAGQASMSITNPWSLLKLLSIESVISSNHLILCHPLLLPSIFPSIRVSSNESVLHIRWPKYWSFSFKISPSNEY